MRISIIKYSLFICATGFLVAQTPTAVVEFEGKGINQTEASALTDRLRSELFQLGTFRVIERGLMEEILTEQGFQQTGCTSDECVVEVGKLIGVHQIIGGSISKVGNIFSISARLINVETGEVISIITVDYEGEIGGLLKEGMRNVALKLAGEEALSFVKGVGSFYITSKPVGAKVWIDGELMEGLTPILLKNIPAGQRIVRLEKDDLAASQTVFLKPQEVKRLTLILAKPTGGVAIISSPLNALAKIDGKEIGRTPITINDLTVGEHLLEIFEKGYVKHEQAIIVAKDLISKVEIKLSKLPKLNIKSVPANAEIFVNGTSIGSTPLENYLIKPGKYFITIRKEKYDFYKAEVLLEPDSIKSIMAELVRKTGSLKISSTPPGASIYLQGKLVGYTPYEAEDLPTGISYLKISLNGYLNDNALIDVKEKEETNRNFNLVSVASVREKISRHNKQRRRWLMMGGIIGLTGGFFQYSSYRHYQQYKTATLNATDLHDTINRENAVYPIVYGLGSLCFLKAVYHLYKREQLQIRLTKNN